MSSPAQLERGSSNHHSFNPFDRLLLWRSASVLLTASALVAFLIRLIH